MKYIPPVKTNCQKKTWGVSSRCRIEKKEENLNYIENFQTAADYCDDLWEEECAKVIRKTYVYPKTNWWYTNEQKIPNIDVNVKTHSEWGPVGKLPGKNPIKY